MAEHVNQRAHPPDVTVPLVTMVTRVVSFQNVIGERIFVKGPSKK